jgi:hypothetical protein
VSASESRRGPARRAAASGHARGGSGGAAAELRSDELTIVTASLEELTRRLEGFHERLLALDAAVQLSAGSTSRSRRARRSSKRSKSS